MTGAGVRAYLLGAIAAVAMTGLSGAASAQTMIDGSDPDAILNLARGFGSATLETDSVGDPLITGRIEGRSYSIWFYGCERNRDCDTILFESVWDVDATDLDRINTFNRDAIHGRAYVNEESDYVIEMTVTLSKGVSRGNLDANFVEWQSLMLSFADFASQ